MKNDISPGIIFSDSLIFLIYNRERENMLNINLSIYLVKPDNTFVDRVFPK